MPHTIQNELQALLTLRFSSGLGNLRIYTLLRHFGNAQAVLAATLPQLREVEGIELKTASSVGGAAAVAAATQELERVRLSTGVKLVGWGLPGYPEALRALHDPPPLLWVKGELPMLEVVPRAIGIVGTRKASPQGIAFTRQLSKELAQAGIMVVSGMARGIDTAAHQACLEGGAVTLGILGSGVDVIYPAENAALSRKVVLITEHPLGTRPAAYNFPARNRIIAALSAGSLIVEGGVDSGAMITATNALECGRTVFAVPGRPLEPLSAGPHKLLREGAVLCESAADILSEFGWDKKVAKAMPELPFEQAAVYRALEGVVLLDDLAHKSGLSVSEAQTALMMLHFQGLIQELPGGRYARA